MKRFLAAFLSTLMIVLMFTSCSNVNTTQEAVTEQYTVYVESEFAPLKKVILSASEYTESKLKWEDCYLTKEEIEELGYEYDDEFIYCPVDQESLDKMAEERAALKELLESYGVEVYTCRNLTDEEREMAISEYGPTHGEGMSNFFARDPLCVVGNIMIELNFNKTYRRFEVLTMREILNEVSAEGNVIYSSMPQIDISTGYEDADGPFLEGGDIMVYHDKVFVGNSGYATGSDGIEWLKNYLSNFGYEVIEVKLQGQILHLDCAMSLVKEGLMIVCEDSFADGIPEEFEDWDKIYVSEEDAQNLAINGLPINEEVYITDIEFKDTIGKELEDRGIKVEYLDFSATRAEKGSIHCSTNPLLRVDD